MPPIVAHYRRMRQNSESQAIEQSCQGGRPKDQKCHLTGTPTKSDATLIRNVIVSLCPHTP